MLSENSVQLHSAAPPRVRITAPLFLYSIDVAKGVLEQGCFIQEECVAQNTCTHTFSSPASQPDEGGGFDPQS